MKQLESKPAVNFESCRKLPFQEALSARDLEKESTGLDVFLKSTNKVESHEKSPLGIETSMVYIAVPVGIAVWASIIYFAKIMFF